MVQTCQGMFRCGRSPHAQVHVESQRVIAAELLPHGVKVNAGGTTRGVVVLVDCHEQAASRACGMRCGRQPDRAVIIAEDRRRIVNVVVGAEMSLP